MASLCICGFCIPYSVLWPALLFLLKQIWDLIRGVKKEEANSDVAKGEESATKGSTTKSEYCGYLGDLKGMDQYQALIRNSENTEAFFILKFTASWCKPCKALAPVFEKVVNEQQENVYAISVDVDDFDELGAKYHAVLLPMVVALHRGEKVEVYHGKDEVELRSFVTSLVSKKKK